MEQRRVEISGAVDRSPEILVTLVRQASKELSPLLRHVNASERMKKHWGEDIDIINSVRRPNTVIAFVGTSGAGKSSLINALLGFNIVATSGVRACTSVITSISYHKETKFEAEIPFVSKEDWSQELRDFQRGLENEEPESPSPDLAIEWDKISTVYPSISKAEFVRMSVDEIMQSQPGTFEKLGSTASIISEKAGDFADKIRPFVDPTVDTRSQLWPIILEVRISCNSSVLSTGATLVDLPGVSDSNAARDAVARDFLKRCNSVFVVAPISRAVTDKLARDLCGEAFRHQLLYGNYNSHAITFIASKTDDIDSKETIKVLRLEHEHRILALDEDIQKVKQYIEEKKRLLEPASRELKTLEREMQAKAGRRTSGQHNTQNSFGKRNMPAEFESSQQHGVDGSAQLANEQAVQLLSSKCYRARYTKMKIEGRIHDAKEDLKRFQRKKNAFCSRRRSEFAIAHIKEDFRKGIEETVKCEFSPGYTRHKTDVFAAFPGALTHTLSSDLNVFTCSGKEFMRLDGEYFDEDEASCFDDIQDTGIPTLRAWCHSVTRPFRIRAANALLDRFHTLVNSACVFINNQTETTHENRCHLKQKWSTDSPSSISSVLKQNFADICNGQQSQLIAKFNGEFSAACKRCAPRSATAAVNSLQEFYDYGNIHHTTFHALLLRYGIFGSRNINLNVRLGSDFKRAITPTWTSIFTPNDLFKSLPNAVLGYIENVVKHVRESAAPGLAGNIKRAEEQCLKEARQKILEITDLLNSTISSCQKEASREFSKILQKKLKVGYDLASSQPGKGRFVREKETLKNFVQNKGNPIFLGTADDLIALFLKAVKDCDRLLRGHLNELADRIEVILAAVWENPRTVQEELKYRKVCVFSEKVRNDPRLRPILEGPADAEPMEM